MIARAARESTVWSPLFFKSDIESVLSSMKSSSYEFREIQIIQVGDSFKMRLPPIEQPPTLILSRKQASGGCFLARRPRNGLHPGERLAYIVQIGDGNQATQDATRKMIQH